MLHTTMHNTHEKLLPRLRQTLRLRHYSRRTEDVYVRWVRDFVRYHGRRHPRELSDREISAYLSMLAQDRKVAAGTQNQALAALLFMYRCVLDIPVSVGRRVVRAKRPKRLPVVMTEEEVWQVIGGLSGD